MALDTLRQAYSTERLVTADSRRASKLSTRDYRFPAVNECSLQVLDEARYMDGFPVGAPANDGGLLQARPASESVPRTTIEAPNSPSPALLSAHPAGFVLTLFGYSTFPTG